MTIKVKLPGSKIIECTHVPAGAILLVIEDHVFTEPFIFPKQLSTFHALNCVGCEHLTRLPDTIFEVRVENCDLRDADALFSPAQLSLESVFLGHNQITHFPENLSSSVVSVDLRNNQIKTLSRQFPKNVTHINLDYNLLEDLPAWILHVTPYLALHGNRFWFNYYTSINLNYPIEEWHVTMAQMHFSTKLADEIQQALDRQRRTEPLEYEPVTVEMVDQDLPGHGGGGGYAEIDFVPLARTFAARIQHPVVPSKKTTSENGQNVHLSSIQESFGDSVEKIMTHPAKKHIMFLEEMRDYYGTWYSFVWSPSVVRHARSMCKTTTISSRHGVRYAELLERVWAISDAHEHRDTIRAILKQEILDGARMCFTGQITRIANSLSGFIEGVEIKISPTEQINNAMIAVMRRCEKDPKLDAREEARKILVELQVPEERQGEWLDVF